MIEAPHWPNWHMCDLTCAASLADAVASIGRTRFHAILLDPGILESTSASSGFVALHRAARGTPILAVTSEEDEALELALLRQGAQDVVLKPGLTSAQLARSLRYAMERQRWSEVLESRSFFDPLTGLYNMRGFYSLAERDVRLAGRRGEPLVVATIGLDGTSEPSYSNTRELRDVIMIRAAELLPSCFDNGAVLARLGEAEFGVCAPGASENAVALALAQFGRNLNLQQSLSIVVGIAAYQPERPCGLSELLAEARSTSLRKSVMLAH